MANHLLASLRIWGRRFRSSCSSSDAFRRAACSLVELRDQEVLRYSGGGSDGEVEFRTHQLRRGVRLQRAFEVDLQLRHRRSLQSATEDAVVAGHLSYQSAAKTAQEIVRASNSARHKRWKRRITSEERKVIFLEELVPEPSSENDDAIGGLDLDRCEACVKQFMVGKVFETITAKQVWAAVESEVGPLSVEGKALVKQILVKLLTAPERPGGPAVTSGCGDEVDDESSVDCGTSAVFICRQAEIADVSACGAVPDDAEGKLRIDVDTKSSSSATSLAARGVDGKVEATRVQSFMEYALGEIRDMRSGIEQDRQQAKKADETRRGRIEVAGGRVARRESRG